MAILFATSCKQTPTTTDKEVIDTSSVKTQTDTSSMSHYDPAMDPLLVGANFSKKLGDSLGIKMFEVTLKPGDSLTLHTHPDHTIYVLQGGKAAFFFEGGARDTGVVKAGAGWIAGPYTDIVKNIGNTTIKWVEVDIYRPRNQ